MPTTSELITLTAAVIGIIGNIVYVSKKYGELEQKVQSLEDDMKEDKKARDDLGNKIDVQGERLRSVETNIAGLSVKVDNVKEGVDEVKKMMMEHVSAFNKR